MRKQPIIGITAGYLKFDDTMEGVYVHHDYHRSIVACGGIPIVIPTTNPELAKHQIDLCDGVIVSGGEDVDPIFYQSEPHQHLGFTNPERDEFEIAVIQHVLEHKKPLLAICRGIQILNVALGGTLIQDISSQLQNALQHTQRVPRGRDSHWVSIKENTTLRQIFGIDKVRVNSLHHQAIDRVSDRLNIVATASDGIIEAVEYTDTSFAIGVQWHPESMAANGNPLMKALFQEFVNRARLFCQNVENDARLLSC
jgi:putative glutamine amidotransferase